jgi:hypothetical protein
MGSSLRNIMRKCWICEAVVVKTIAKKTSERIPIQSVLISYSDLCKGKQLDAIIEKNNGIIIMMFNLRNSVQKESSERLHVLLALVFSPRPVCKGKRLEVLVVPIRLMPPSPDPREERERPAIRGCNSRKKGEW